MFLCLYPLIPALHAQCTCLFAILRAGGQCSLSFTQNIVTKKKLMCPSGIAHLQSLIIHWTQDELSGVSVTSHLLETLVQFSRSFSLIFQSCFQEMLLAKSTLHLSILHSSQTGALTIARQIYFCVLVSFPFFQEVPFSAPPSCVELFSASSRCQLFDSSNQKGHRPFLDYHSTQTESLLRHLPISLLLRLEFWCTISQA